MCKREKILTQRWRRAPQEREEKERMFTIEKFKFYVKHVRLGVVLLRSSRPRGEVHRRLPQTCGCGLCTGGGARL